MTQGGIQNKVERDFGAVDDLLMPLNSKEQHLGFGFVHLRGCTEQILPPGGSFGWRPQSFQRLLLQGLGESLPSAQSPLTEAKF